MNILKHLIRNYAAPFSIRLGLDKLIRWRKKNGHLNLMFHGVCDDKMGFSKRNISTRDFEFIIRYLKDNFDIISLKDSFDVDKNGQTISITFDDGFKNNYTKALPILEKYQANATVFVSSLVTDSKFHGLLYPEVFSALKFFYSDRNIVVRGRNFYNLKEVESGILLQDYLNQLKCDERGAYIEKLIDNYHLTDKLQNVDENLWKLMSKDELFELSKSPYIEIGSHTNKHFKLSNCRTEVVNNELINSKKLLESTLGSEIDTLAYPYGDYSDEVIELSKEAGYRYLLTVDYNESSHSEIAYLSSRHGISTMTNKYVNILLLNLAFRQNN